MPTTQEEASKIASLSIEYFPIDKLAELFIKLDDEVGKKTNNDSLKVSLQMMRGLMESHADNIKQLPPPNWMFPAFCGLVFVHAMIVIGMAFSFLILPFLAPWYVALPLCTFIWFFSSNQIDCKLTALENNMRRQLGMKRIGGFVGHYFLKPIKKMWYNN